MYIQNLIRRNFILIFIPVFLGLACVKGQGDETSTTAQPATPPVSNNQEALKGLQVRVKGSLCPACLKQLQKKLSATDGISDVTVKSYALEHYGQDDKSLSNDEKKSATYTMKYDSAKISQKQIEDQFKSSDFRIANVKELE
jgi:copper chaperone CopZ